MNVGSKTKFTDIFNEFQPTRFGKNEKHLRFKTVAGKPSVLYTHSCFKRSGQGEAAAVRRAGKHEAASTRIHAAIDDEHGPGTADRVFAHILEKHGKDLTEGIKRNDLKIIKDFLDGTPSVSSAPVRGDPVETGLSLTGLGTVSTAKETVTPGTRKLLDGAQQLMDRVAPRWCSSGRGPDGLPPIQTRVDERGVEVLSTERGVENDFAKWLRAGPGAGLPRGGNMCCWEAVLASGVEGGVLNKKQVETMYQVSPGGRPDVESLLNHCGYSEARDVDWEKNPPKPGDIIVVDNVRGSSREVGFHVMIAGEDGDVFSHDRSEESRSHVGPGLPSRDCMVKSSFAKTMQYIENSIMGNEGEARVRYLRPPWLDPS